MPRRRATTISDAKQDRLEIAMSTHGKRQLSNKGCRWKAGINKRDANMSEKNQQCHGNGQYLQIIEDDSACQ